jgi:hypothetical protein
LRTTIMERSLRRVPCSRQRQIADDVRCTRKSPGSRWESRGFLVFCCR